MQTKKVLTNIQSRLSLGFQNITFGKSGSIAHGNMFMFKELVENELKNGSINEYVDVISENGYGLNCLCDFDKCMKLELINSDGFLSSLTTVWNYTFTIYFDIEANNLDEFISKVDSVKSLFVKYTKLDVNISNISGIVNDKPMSRASHPNIELHKFFEEYK